MACQTSFLFDINLREIILWLLEHWYGTAMDWRLNIVVANVGNWSIITTTWDWKVHGHQQGIDGLGLSLPRLWLLATTFQDFLYDRTQGLHWTWKRRQSKHLDEGSINWNAWAGGRLVENHALILSTGGWAPQLADSYFDVYAKTRLACHEAVIKLEVKVICCHRRYCFQITIWQIN